MAPLREDSKELFTTLPAELLQMICKQINTTDALRLRRVFPKARQDHLAASLSAILFIAPSRRSLGRLVHICQNPFLQKCITEVRFVCLVPFVELGSDDYEFNRMMSRGGWVPSSASDEELTDLAFQASLRLRHQHALSGDEADWERDATNTRWPRCLSVCLARLPNLRKAALVHGIDTPGINATALNFSQDMRRTRRAQLPPWRRDNDEPTWLTMQELGEAQDLMHGSEAFLKAVKAQKPKIKELALGQGLVQGVMIGLTSIGFDSNTAMNSIGNSTLRSLFAELTRLSIAAAFGDPEGYQQIGWKAMFQAATKVKHLELYDVTHRWTSSLDGFDEDNGRQAIHQALLFGDFPDLESLHIIGQDDHPCCIAVSDFMGFLRRHQTKLEEVRLTSVFMTDFDPRVWDNSLRPMKAALKVCRHIYRFKRFEMTLPRHDQHRVNCIAMDMRVDTCDCEGAGYEVGGPGSHSHDVLEFYDLAWALQIRAKDEVWDFGEYVRRPVGSDDDLFVVDKDGDEDILPAEDTDSSIIEYDESD